MFDILDNPRVQELLAQAEDAVTLMQDDADPTAGHDVADALTAIYGELGRAVHGLARQAKRTAAPTPKLSAVAPHDDYTGEDDLTAIPGPEELLLREEAFLPSRPVAIDLQSLAGVMGTSSRSGDLYALLSLLTPPVDLIDPASMPEEASKVQWASGELSGRLADAAREVQIAVLAMLAARARNVAAHLDVDIGPRMALDRLKRYRDHEDLPWVQGLLPNARPEHDTWAEDAAAYWALLRPA